MTLGGGCRGRHPGSFDLGVGRGLIGAVAGCSFGAGLGLQPEGVFSEWASGDCTPALGHFAPGKAGRLLAVAFQAACLRCKVGTIGAHDSHLMPVRPKHISVHQHKFRRGYVKIFSCLWTSISNAKKLGHK